ncbi:MAG: Dam family site-specific DNA-(adenine-N6)-methyltransferase [Chloroflexota bacterium]
MGFPDIVTNRPFLKWAGGKVDLVQRVLWSLPDGKRLIEPFAGSCAVALNTSADRFVMADTNRDLIDLYTWLQHCGPDFIEDCNSLFQNRIKEGHVKESDSAESHFEESNSEEFYYACRQEFNETALGDYWRSVLFVYLNRHSYNGLCHYDEDGHFDVPYGMYRKPRCPSQEMRYFYHWAQNAEFVQADFRSVMDEAQPGDFFYCDPPNLPLTTIDGLVVPMDQAFTMSDHVELAVRAEALAARGIPVIISNLDTPEARALYASAKIDAFPVRRYIRYKNGARGKIWEVVAVFGHA